MPCFGLTCQYKKIDIINILILLPFLKTDTESVLHSRTIPVVFPFTGSLYYLTGKGLELNLLNKIKLIRMNTKHCI